MNKGKVEIVKFSKSKDTQVFEYAVEHNNGSTSVEQVLTISSVDGLRDQTWKAEIKLDDFPPQKTPAEAANKLADWLERLAAAMRKGEYIDLQRAEFKDLDE